MVATPSACCANPLGNVEFSQVSTMETRLPMTTDDHPTVDAPPNADSALTLGGWVSSLAGDARAVAEASLRDSAAPLRAGLRHLLHIVPLSRGIESLAMLEVAIVLRVTAQRPEVTDESSPLSKLQTEAAFVDAVFPEEKSAIWRFCDGLVERERELARRLEAARQTDLVAEHNDAQQTSTVDDAPQTSEDADQTAVHSDVTSAESSGTNVSPEAKYELIERVLAWVETYQPPTFGDRPHDLTRARAFIRTRIEAWENA